MIMIRNLKNAQQSYEAKSQAYSFFWEYSDFLQIFLQQNYFINQL